MNIHWKFSFFNQKVVSLRLFYNNSIIKKNYDNESFI